LHQQSWQGDIAWCGMQTHTSSTPKDLLAMSRSANKQSFPVSIRHTEVDWSQVASVDQTNGT
jgi:hypothetical protein